MADLAQLSLLWPLPASCPPSAFSLWGQSKKKSIRWCYQHFFSHSFNPPPHMLLWGKWTPSHPDPLQHWRPKVGVSLLRWLLSQPNEVKRFKNALFQSLQPEELFVHSVWIHGAHSDLCQIFWWTDCNQNISWQCIIIRPRPKSNHIACGRMTLVPVIQLFTAIQLLD